MGSAGRYIFQTTFGAFFLVLTSLTTVIWLTHALREVDLMTNRGQTILVFLGITTFALPQIVVVVAPIALMIAVIYTLNKLTSDSELIVMNASGMSPWTLFRPIIATALVVAIGVGLISAYIGPKYMRQLRDWVTSIRADMLTTIVQPGRFTPLEYGLTFHIRERGQDGRLYGIMVDDRRDPKEQATFIAESGDIVKSEQGTFLVLNIGNVQRHPADQHDPTIVVFERYAFDLSRFAGGPPSGTLSVRERYAWELLTPDPNDPSYKREPRQFLVEFCDRLATPLYPLAFAVLAFAFLGAPRTTRQSAGLLLAATIVSAAVLRTAGFVSVVLGVRFPAVLALQFVAFALTFWFGLRFISHGSAFVPPAIITETISAVTERLTRRFATT